MEETIYSYSINIFNNKTREVTYLVNELVYGHYLYIF